MNKRIERFLRSRGLVLNEIRLLVRNQIYLCLGGMLLLAVFSPGAVWIGFAVGAVLGTANFYFLACFVQELVYHQGGAVFPLLVSFYLRLGITGVILVASVVYWEANIYSLLAGLSIVLLNVLIFGAVLVSQKFKEA
ncbi:MAG: ATP synthase subunit I [Desulfonatronovibrionaceae bacterium]